MYSRSAPRRRHSVELKAQVLAACDEPGASISGVALAHGLNANLVRQWRSGRGVQRVQEKDDPQWSMASPDRSLSEVSPVPGARPEFVAIAMPAAPKTPVVAASEPTRAASSGEAAIHVELRRGSLHLSVHWPTTAASDCTAWLRELSSGLLK